MHCAAKRMFTVLAAFSVLVMISIFGSVLTDTHSVFNFSAYAESDYAVGDNDTGEMYDEGDYDDYYDEEDDDDYYSDNDNETLSLM